VCPVYINRVVLQCAAPKRFHYSFPPSAQSLEPGCWADDMLLLVTARHRIANELSVKNIVGAIWNSFSRSVTCRFVEAQRVPSHANQSSTQASRHAFCLHSIDSIARMIEQARPWNIDSCLSQSAYLDDNRIRCRLTRLWTVSPLTTGRPRLHTSVAYSCDVIPASGREEIRDRRSY